MFYSHSHLRVWSWCQIWIIWSQEARLTAKHYLHSNETVWSLFEIHLMQLIPGNGVKLARTWSVSQTAEMLDMMTDPKFTGEKCCVYLLVYALEVCLMSKCCQRECKLVSSWCLSYDELGKSCGWHIIYWAAHLFLLLIELCVKVRTHEINHVHYSQAPLMQQEYM